MSEFGQDDGFYSGGYGENQGQHQDISYVQGFRDDQQFGQFDYSQGYGGDPQYLAPQQTTYNPTIMTPDPSAYTAKEAPGDNYEDEPPLMEELGINFDHIIQKRK